MSGVTGTCKKSRVRDGEHDRKRSIRASWILRSRGGGFNRQLFTRWSREHARDPSICQRGGKKIEKVMQNDAF